MTWLLSRRYDVWRVSGTTARGAHRRNETIPVLGVKRGDREPTGWRESGPGTASAPRHVSPGAAGRIETLVGTLRRVGRTILGLRIGR